MSDMPKGGAAGMSASLIPFMVKPTRRAEGAGRLGAKMMAGCVKSSRWMGGRAGGGKPNQTSHRVEVAEVRGGRIELGSADGWPVVASSAALYAAVGSVLTERGYYDARRYIDLLEWH